MPQNELKASNCPCFYAPQDPDKQGLLDDQLQPVTIYEWSPETMQSTVGKDPDKFRTRFTRTKAIDNSILVVGSATFNNAWSQLVNLANSQEDGPHYVDGRDGVITVHNGKRDGKPVFEYTYAGGTGELLEVSIKTKYTQTIEAARSTGIDPDTKQQKTSMDQVISDNPCGPYDDQVRWSGSEPDYLEKPDALYMGYFPEIEANKGQVRKTIQRNRFKKPTIKKPVKYHSENEAIADLAKNTWITQDDVIAFDKILREKFDEYQKKYDAWVNSVKEAKKSNGEITELPPVSPMQMEDLVVRRTVEIEVDPRDYDPQGKHGTGTEIAYSSNSQVTMSTDNKYWNAGYKVLQSGKGLTPNSKVEIIYSREGYKMGDEVRIRVTLDVPIPGQRVWQSSYQSEMGSIQKNQLIESVNSQIELRAKFVGNPRMESSQTTTIHNIGVTYSGDYYAKEVDHQFTAGSGYFTQVTYQKKSKSTILNSVSMEKSYLAAYKKAHEIGDQAMKDGTWAIADQVNTIVSEIRKEQEQQKGSDRHNQIYIVQDKEDPRNISVYQSKRDLDAGKPLKQFQVGAQEDSSK